MKIQLYGGPADGARIEATADPVLYLRPWTGGEFLIYCQPVGNSFEYRVSPENPAIYEYVREIQ